LFSYVCSAGTESGFQDYAYNLTYFACLITATTRGTGNVVPTTDVSEHCSPNNTAYDAEMASV